jgi:hypothetical protein
MSIHHVSKTKLNSSHTIFNNLQTLTSTLENLRTHADHTKFDGGTFSPLDKDVFYLLHCFFFLIIYTPLQHLTIPSLIYYPLSTHPPQSHTFTYMIFFPHPLPFRIRLSQPSMGSVLIRA